MRTSSRSDERGVALILTLLLAMVVTTIAIGMILMSGNGTIISKFHTTEAVMEAAADAGLEQGRDTLNGTPTIVSSAGGFDTLELRTPVKDANGNVIPGFTRSVYAGMSGNISGQYGTYASVISVIENPRGAVVVRRAELAQESFAKFARFDNRTTSAIRFARGIQVFGPLHTNQTLYVDNSGGAPTFHGPVTTAATISVASQGIFEQGYKENQAVIPMPTPAALATLAGYATAGGTWLAGGAVGTGVFDSDTRIEFVAIDINRDGDVSDENEGFFRVFSATGARPERFNYVSARRWMVTPAPAPSSFDINDDPNILSGNCGGTWSAANGGDNGWWPAESIYVRRRAGGGSADQARTAVRSALRSAAHACYLGGDQRLAKPAPVPGTFQWNFAPYGTWRAWPGWAGVPPAAIQNAWWPAPVPGGNGVVGTGAQYLWPATRAYDPNFKGVIYVSGSTAISGQVRGRVTVAATGNVMLADDLKYVTPPGNDPECEADILGVLTPQFFMLEDNSVNAPFMVGDPGGATYVTGFDDSPEESLQGAVLTLQSIQAEDVFGGSSNSETCVSLPVGRGCFNMFGSAIQDINGSRMGGGGTGWNPQWTYDRCMGVAPPPYYPTTGRFFMNRHYEIDPVGFDVATWFADNQSGI